MAEEHFYMKRGDTRPELQVTLKDGTGTAVNVTGTTIKFSMKNKLTGQLKINEGTVTIVTAASGVVKYTWVAADTDTVGEYEAEFEVTFGGGAIETFANSKANRLLVHIISELA